MQEVLETLFVTVLGIMILMPILVGTGLVTNLAGLA